LITALANADRFKILSLTDAQGNSVLIHYKDFPPHRKGVTTLPGEIWKLELLLISVVSRMGDIMIHLARHVAAE